MSLTHRIAELERELSKEQTEVELRMARVRAIAHELRELKGLASPGGPLTEVALTDAIVRILRAGSGFGPKSIQAELLAAGRDVPLNKVTATLTYLVKQQRVSRTGRGEYMAT